LRLAAADRARRRASPHRARPFEGRRGVDISCAFSIRHHTDHPGMTTRPANKVTPAATKTAAAQKPAAAAATKAAPVKTAAATTKAVAAAPTKVAAAVATKAPALKTTAAAAKAVAPKQGKPPATKAAQVPVTDENGDIVESPEKKSRVQLAQILHINISQARCATHLKQNLGDETTEAEIKELRKGLKAAKDAEATAEEIEAIKAQITEKSRTLVRISSETPIAAAVIWDCGIKELLRHGMDQAVASDRKIVEVSHLHDGAPSDLLYWPLYKKCPAWTDYDPDHEDELKKERANANKAAKEAREAKKAAPVVTGKAAAGKAGAKAPAKVVEEPEEEEDHAEHTKTTFYTYVENSLKTVKKDEPYKSMRVSNRVREYLSDLVAQGIARLAHLARIIVQRVMGVRTMNADHVKAVVDLLMSDEGRDPQQVDEVTAQIDEKLAVYHEHLDSEKVKKAAALGDDKKAENERKQLEAELARKLKQTELANKRSVDAAQKVKELTAETAKLEPVVAAKKAAFEASVALAAAAQEEGEK
jgi:hypothetical protein